jgi:hypothetical protein
MKKLDKEKQMLEKLKKLNPIYANIKPNNRDTKKLYFKVQNPK